MNYFLKLLKNEFNNLFLACKPVELRRKLTNYFGWPISLELMDGKGATSVFRVDKQGCGPVAIVRVINWRREKKSSRANSNSPYFHFFPGSARLEREFKLLKKLSPHGLSPCPILLDDNFAVHEFCPGPLLSEKIHLKPEEIFERGWNAVRNLHVLGEVHGDPGPQNIIDTADGLKFIDFEHSLNLQRYDSCHMRAFDYVDYCLHSWRLLKKNSKISFQQYLFAGKGGLTGPEIMAVTRIIKEIPYELSFKELFKTSI